MTTTKAIPLTLGPASNGKSALGDFDRYEPEDEHAPTVTIEVNPMVGAREYTLLVPLTVNGSKLRKVTMRLPSQGDIDDWANGELESYRALLCRLTGLDPIVVKHLRWVDSEALHQMMRDIAPEFVFADGAA